MNGNTRFWERGYSSHDVWAMGGPSIEVVDLEKVLPRNSNVLDIGCGDGRNAIFLALYGHNVTAIEISSNAVNKIRRVAELLSLSINVIEMRIENFVPYDTYDFVLAHSSLHFVEKQVWMPLMQRLCALTKGGGFHNITSFIGTERYPIPPECRHANSFERGDLDRIYSDWQIIRSDFYAKWDSHPGVPMHVHVVEKFVARKSPINEPQAFIPLSTPDSDPIDDGLFEALPLNIDKAAVIDYGVLPKNIHRTIMPSVILSTSGPTIEEYEIEDWIFGNKVLQYAQGNLTGKYEYFTQLFYLSGTTCNLIEK